MIETKNVLYKVLWVIQDDDLCPYLQVLRGHKSSVRDVAYMPTGRHIASAAMDGDVKLWAADSGAQVLNTLFPIYEILSL